MSNDKDNFYYGLENKIKLDEKVRIGTIFFPTKNKTNKNKIFKECLN